MNPTGQSAEHDEAAAKREARSHLAIAIGWIFGAAVCVALIVVLAMLRFEDHPLESGIEMVAAAIAVYVAVGNARFELMLRRAVQSDAPNDE